MGEGWGIGDVRRCRQVDVGMVFGVSVKTVREWGTAGGCPRNGDGTYDVREVLKWYVARERDASSLPELSEEERGDAVLMAALLAESPARERLVHYKAEKARIEYEQACERLVPREQVRELLGALAVRLRDAGEMLARNFGGSAGRVLEDVLSAREWGRYGVGPGEDSPQRHRGHGEGRDLTTKGTKGHKGRQEEGKRKGGKRI